MTLASASPRRRELLQLLGLDYDVAVSGVDETPGEGEDTPERLAESLALRKAKAVAAKRSSGLVLGADTVVALDGVVFGKPADVAEAEATLRALRGRTHTVITGVALVDAATGESVSSYDATQVTMREFSDAEMAAYIATGNPMDKAGAYAAQDASFHPAAAIEGCWTNVIGLPVCRVRAMLRERGVDTPAGDEWGPADGCSGCAAIPERGWPLP
ncbi:MAG: Maf family protein [Chloroflexota bacterium]|nr:Maf family protein [Chloroflexota bacterium]